MSDTRRASRRDFLKTSSAAFAGAALASGLSVARSAHAAGSGELKVVLIGCGGRGQGAIRDCMNASKITGEKIRLIAVADAFEKKARDAFDRLKKEGDYSSMVDVPDDRVFSGFDCYEKAIAVGPDLVILATSPGFRPIHYQAAIAAGKHVFMEKPCCVDAPGYRSLLETNKAADAKGLKVGVGLQRHHEPRYQETIKRIQDGAIGDLKYLRAYWNGAGVWVRPRRPEQTEMEYQMDNWYYFVWLSGDHICEQHVHNLDVCNWVKGGHPVEANGMGGRQVRRGKDVGHIYDHHFIEFTYDDGTKMFSQCRHIPKCWDSVSEFAHGTKGWADCSGKELHVAGKKQWEFLGERPSAMVQEHADLQKAIRSGEPYNEGHYGADSSFTAVLGRMATYSGQVVKWDDAVAGGPSEMPETYAWDAKPPVLPDESGSYEHAVAMPGIYKAY
ncbi:MAG: Gfo/Idh/MocA family oxidoreductase [Pirellulales bacterium]|nr:Gfo/Idh/MocA family oxidoreductase [Pirellulales bacterium]